MSKTRSRTLCLLLFEGALSCLCGLSALVIRFGGEAHDVLVYRYGWVKILLATAVVQAAFYLFDLYDFGMIRQRDQLFVRILQALGLASIALAFIFYVVPRLTIGRGVFLVSM